MNNEMQDIHKESKLISSDENQQTQEKRFFQTYKDYSDNFQRQIEKTVTQRNELLGKVYLEYLKHYKHFADNVFEYQDNFLAKNGVKIDALDFCMVHSRNSTSLQVLHIQTRQK